MPDLRQAFYTGFSMVSHARVVVIGGGLVGCSILYHLAKMGWKDLHMFERDELTSGSTWHAAAGLHGLHDNNNISKLQYYTMKLYKELEEETGITAADIEVDIEFKFKHRYLVNNQRSGNEPKKKKLIIYLASLIRNVDIKLTEHDNYEWILWNPPHQIQEKTIDPLLKQLAEHWERRQDAA